MQNKIKKIIPYCLILIILVGLFSPMAQVSAQPGGGTCTRTYHLSDGTSRVDIQQKNSAAECPSVVSLGAGGSITSVFIPYSDTNIDKNPDSTEKTTEIIPPTPSTADNAFQRQIDDGCGGILSSTFSGCFLKLVYYTIFQIPSFLLWLSAQFFNALISLAINSSMTADSTFIPMAWAVVRDLSNIFFILILLYAAIQTILGLGHETKKMIVQVIIMALLINFSMFFTKVVIDSSNILALVFYNKLDTDQKNIDGTSRPFEQTTKDQKDISGAMYRAFDATQLLSQENLKKLKTAYALPGKPITEELPLGITLGFMIIAGLIMLYAAYTFFVAGLSFLGRLVELWILIIFSPFAFMSSTVPKMAGIEYLGWEAWLKRLIATSFMAPIFMFFMYLIFKLLQVLPVFSSGKGAIVTILQILIPALIILAMLKKATEYAEKGGGEFGKMAISGAKLAAGLAVGGVALGGAVAGRAVIGGVAKSIQNDSARGKALQLGSNLKDNFKGWNKVNPAAYARSVGIVGKAATAGIASGIHAIPAGGGKTVGERMKEEDEGYGHKTHATHTLDAKMQSEFGHQYGKDAKYKDLTEHEQVIVKAEVDKDEMAKFVYGKLFKDLEAPQAAAIQGQYKGVAYADPVTGTTVTPSAPQRPVDDGHGKTVRIADSTAPLGPHEKVKSDYVEDTAKSSAAIGEFVQALRKGNYDIRNLPDMSAKSKGFPKIGVGTIALIAAGVRMGLKKGGGVEYGTPQGNILKDIGNTISEALKNVKINVSGGGEHGGGDSHTKEVKSVGH